MSSKEIVKLLRGCRNLFVLTGSGISAPSQVPIYSGADGMWAKLSATGINPMLLLRKTTIRNEPAKVWAWVNNYRKIVLKAKPNAAHKALVRLQEHYVKNHMNFTLATQNLDGLHSLAIRESPILSKVSQELNPQTTQEMIELHGSVRQMSCNSECCSQLYPIPDTLTGTDFPKCPKCGAPMRPNMLLFDECYSEEFCRSTTAIDRGLSCGVMLVVGTELQAQLANAMVYDHVLNMKPLIEINTKQVIKSTDSNVFHMIEPCEKALPRLVDELLSSEI